MFLFVARDFSSEEAVRADCHFSDRRALNARETGLLRTHRLIKIKTRLLWIIGTPDTKCEVQSGLEIVASIESCFSAIAYAGSFTDLPARVTT